MDARTDSAHLPQLTGLSGPHAGQIYSLDRDVIIIGRAPDSDIVVDVKGIKSVHALIAVHATTMTIRAWPGKQVKVNGEETARAELRNGDRLAIGSSVFQLKWIPLPKSESPQVDGLRVQAAAVVAQQASLSEQERQLRQRETTLEQQERQIADRLEARKTQLEELHRQLREVRAQWRRDLAGQRGEVDTLRQELDQRQARLTTEEAELQTQRDRLLALRPRLIARWRRHWSTQRVEWEKKNAELEKKRSQFEDFRKKFHAQAELARQQLLEQREKLRTTHETWLKEHESSEADLARREREYAEAQQNARAEFEEAQRHCARLRIEAEGLENRIRHSREALQKQEQRRAEWEQASLLLPVPFPSAAHSGNRGPTPPACRFPAMEPFPSDPQLEDQRQAELNALAEELSDQQTFLVEQLAQLARMQDSFRSEQRDILRQCEELAFSLRDQEQEWSTQLEALQQIEAELQVRTAQLNADEISRQAEREREEFSAQRRRRREEALTELCHRWALRRKEELSHLREELNRCRESREAWTQRRTEIESYAITLREEQRQLAERALLLKQARDEMIAESKNPDVAEKQLQRLQRHLKAAWEKHKNELIWQQDELRAEQAEIDKAVNRLLASTQELARREAAWANQSADVERDDYLSSGQEAQPDQSLSLWQAQRASYEREIDELRNEVERLAALLLDRPDEDKPQEQLRAA